MNDEQILGLIREALFEVSPNRVEDFKNINLDTAIADLSLDSIATMEMVGYLEDKVETTFPDEKLATVNKLGDLARLVRENATA
jgi:acyl carrier protein